MGLRALTIPLIYAVATLANTLIIGLCATSSWTDASFFESPNIISLAVSIFCTVAALASWISSNPQDDNPGEARLFGLISLSASFAVVSISSASTPFFGGTSQWFAIVGNAVVTLCWSTYFLQDKQTSARFQRQYPWIISALLFIVASILFNSAGSRGMMSAIALVSFLRDAAFVGLPLILLTNSIRNYAALPRFSEFFKAHFFLRGALPKHFSPKTLITSGAILSACANLYAYIFSDATAQGAATLPIFLAITALITCNKRIKQVQELVAQQSLVYQLTPQATKRFVLRHRAGDEFVSESVGLKTAHFIIDHDPDSVLASSLPAPLLAIRSAEIMRLLSDFMHAISLHESTLGERSIHVIDPEQVIRPCTDALRIFASVYLDTLPLIEKRIQQLTEVLPIIDQPLTNAFELHKFRRILAQTNWIFYLDYGWMDQSMVKLGSSVRYVFQQDTMTPKISETLLRFIKKAGTGSNFAWISPSARDKLQQEAPLLSEEIEPCPVHDEETGKELLIFRIRFENLVPILQKFYQLEHMRTKGIPADTTDEGARMLHILERRMLQSQQISEFSSLIETIGGYPWQTRREHEGALNLLTRIFHRFSGIQSISSNQAPEHSMESLRSAIANAVNAIGYPGQSLHTALRRKQDLREMSTLLASVSDRANPNCADSWMILATIRMERYSSAEQQLLISFLQNINETPNIGVKDPFILAKAIDTFSCVCRSGSNRDVNTVNKSALSLCGLLVKGDAPAEIWAYLLDTFAFIRSFLKDPNLFNPQFTDAVDQLISRRSSSEHILVQVSELAYRWQKIKSTRDEHSQLDLKAG
jgi:hypothetical protein